MFKKIMMMMVVVAMVAGIGTNVSHKDWGYGTPKTKEIDAWYELNTFSFDAGEWRETHTADGYTIKTYSGSWH